MFLLRWCPRETPTQRKPPSLEIYVTGHFTSSETRTDHELAGFAAVEEQGRKGGRKPAVTTE